MTKQNIGTELDPTPIPHHQATKVRNLVHEHVQDQAHRQTILDALFQTPRHEQLGGSHKRIASE